MCLLMLSVVLLPLQSPIHSLHFFPHPILGPGGLTFMNQITFSWLGQWQGQGLADPVLQEFKKKKKKGKNQQAIISEEL